MAVEIFNSAVRKAMSRAGLSQEDLFARLGYSRRSLFDHFSTIKMCEIAFLLDTPADTLWDLSGDQDKRDYDCAIMNFEQRFCSDEVIAWAKQFPIRDLQRLGHIQSTEGISFNKRFKSGFIPREIMKFMNVVSIDGWKKTYATALGTQNPQVYSAWIRLGELQTERSAEEIPLFREVIANNLMFLRRNALPLKYNLRQIIIDTLQKCDITILQVPAFITAPAPKVASYWRGLRPVIQLPTTKVSDSEFLESVYHAMGHILQSHSKRPCLLAPRKIPGLYHSATDEHCKEATRIAESLLLSEAEECEIICCGHFAEKKCIEFFSRKFQVRPSVIVSRLQQQNKLRSNSSLNAFKIAV